MSDDETWVAHGDECLEGDCDGTLFPVEISVTYLADLRVMVAFIRDVSERKKAEAGLR